MKKLWKTLAVAVTLVAAVVGTVAFSNNATAKAASNKKTLVVYFSRTKGVYGGSLSKGNTAQVANFIKQKTGADTYEIVPKKAYPNGYDQTTKVAQREQDRDARPAMLASMTLSLSVAQSSGVNTQWLSGPSWTRKVA